MLISFPSCYCKIFSPLLQDSDEEEHFDIKESVVRGEDGPRDDYQARYVALASRDRGR